MIRLRSQQVRVIEDIERAIASGHRRIMVQAPTGFGKTIVAAAIAGDILAANKRAIFTVPALSLIDQTVARFHANGISDVGVIQGNHRLTNHDRPIQVASVQTLQRRQIPAADLVMIDEAHRWYDAYPAWLNGAWRDIPVIGMSATPWTKGLGKHFDKLIIAATTEELIEAGFLSKFRVFAPASPDLSGVRTRAGDYRDEDLSAVMDNSGLVADVVDTWLDRAKGRSTLCFAVDCLHARHLQERFIERGVVAGYVDADTTAAEREIIAQRFQAGDIEVVVNVGCLTTGVDWDVRCIILARPTKSEMLFVQMVGRGLRIAAGKDDCLILDHSDNHLRLGFVTDIAYDELEGGRRQKAEPKARPLPKKCPKCSALKAPKVIICPACGFREQLRYDARPRGKLVEFSRKTAQEAQVTLEEQRIFYAELRWIANDSGYKSGWAAYRFKDRFGSTPPWAWNDDPTATPTATTRGYIKAHISAYARQRAS